jgi:carbon-monoxide dehydrogenase medium subunit
MIPPTFDYLVPATLPEAIALLHEHGDEAKVLAGGHSLIPAMRLRFAEPSHLIDISHIPGLDYVREEGGFLKIGAMAREVVLEDLPWITERYPLLVDTTKMIADPQVRNLATVGGNLAHGDPANDHPATMLAYRAEIEITGASGARTVPIDEFFTDFFTTALEHGEILTEIRIPIPPARSGGCYLKVERKVGDYAAAAVAVQLSLAADGSIEQAGIGLTNVAALPTRAVDAENALRGQQPSDALFAQAGQLAADASSPADDLRGSAEYKLTLIRELIQRALHRSVERAQGRS